MIQLHVDLLQNLQQAIFVFNIPSSIDCTIQADQVIIRDEEQHWQTTIHLNNLIIDINKGTEIASPEVGQIRRTFKFPFLRLPNITDHIQSNLNNVTCAKCQSTLKIIAENQTYKIVQQQNANADDINEVIYCHRFCEAHQHEHEHPHQHRLHVPLDLHSELIVLETTECFVIAKEYISSDLITNELVQCHHCSSNLGSFDAQTNLVSFDKCSLLPFSNDYISSCFRQHEPGRYIVKLPKSIDSIFLVWILPNQILAGDASVNSSIQSTQLNFHRMRKLLFTHVTSADNKLFTEWKRDFSVTTLLVNQLCLDHLSTAFQHELEKFPNVYNSNEAFQSLTIAF
jgi:hypothetical protein